MADEAKPKRTSARDAAARAKNAFAALADVQADDVPGPQAQRPAAARTKPAGTRTTTARTARPKKVEAMPVTQDKPPSVWDARINLTLSREMKKALDLARAEDGLELTARIRAMITLWQEDDRLARKVNELAKSLR